MFGRLGLIGVGFGHLGSGGGAGGAPSSSGRYDFGAGTYEWNGVEYASLGELFTAAGKGSFSRASAQYDLRGSQSFGNDVPCITAGYGYLHEPAATNLGLRSKFDAGWSSSNGNATLTLNAVTAPDGTTTAARLIENSAANAERGLSLQQASTSLTAARHVLSMYVKQHVGNRDVNPRLFRSDFGAGASANLFDLNPLGGGGTFAYGTGWSFGQQNYYAAAQSFSRVAASFTTAAFTNFFVIPNMRFPGDTDETYDGDGSSGLAFWGYQLELAAASGYFAHNPSSPIATTTASASRAACAMTLPVPAGLGKATVTFGNASTQEFTGLSDTWVVPHCPTLNRPDIALVEFSA